MPVFRPEGSNSQVLAELARLWDQACAHRPGQVTQKKLANVSGVPYSTVNGWATGAAEPRDLDQLVQVGATLAKWANELGLSVREWDLLMAADRPRRASAADAAAAGRSGQATAAERVRIGLIPQSADCFQERQVSEHIQAGADAGGTVVLGGMGGVGKTQLAAAYARRAWQRGIDVLVWVNAATRESIVSAYADTAVRLGLPLADRDDREHAAQEFLTWAEITSQRWLVVLDDVHRPTDLSGLWPPAATSPAPRRVLITTRLREAALAGTDRHIVEIGTFAQAEACSYLTAKLGGQVQAADLDGLAADLGFLPLALAQAAAYIINADISCAEYRQRLVTRLLAHSVPGEDYLPDGHRRVVTAAWELSIDNADRVAPAKLARPVLRLVSVLDPAGIPQTVLTSPPALKGLTRYVTEPAADASVEDAGGVDETMVDEALRVLHRHSLLDHDRTATHHEIRIHQLIQRATRENLTVQPGLGPYLFTQLAHTAADALLHTWPPIERDHLGQLLRANATALHNTTGSVLYSPETGAHPVLLHATTSLGKAGQVAAAITACTDLYTTFLHHLGRNHPDTLAVRHNLAHWRGQAGDAAGAAAAYEELLADRLRVQGPDHPDTLIARGNLARWQGEAGNVTGAAAAYEELLADHGRILGNDHPDTLTIRHNLAHWRGQGGDVTGAVATCEELLADHERILGPDHPDTLATRASLARWRGEAGDVGGAAAAYEELLADRLRVLGPDHPDTLTARQDLGHWRGEAGDEEGAVAMYEKLLADRLRVLGPDHPDTLTTRHNLGHWRGRSGDAAGAAAAFEELLNDRLRVQGLDHPGTLSTRQDLGHWRGQAGDEESAVAAYEELLTDCERVLGPDHPDTLTTRNNLAHWRGRSGDAAGAAAAYEELLADRLRVLGPDHPGILTTRNNLAGWRGESGDKAGAAAAYEELLADRLRVQGPDHPDTLTTRRTLAVWRERAASEE
ncbi:MULTISPECIES: FxSxx-COOH system tetratricopeptide repeat protein [unclassified Nonomuraea]|uniref:FxSxx-COOH system tetratricopeptide repeat protein n=1 Tax=unclassified Nonomuraea TaxID=2593643 RepID=UPI00340365AB